MHFCKHEISTAKTCISSSLDFSVCAFGFDRIQTINLKVNMDICHIWGMCVISPKLKLSMKLIRVSRDVQITK